VADSPAGRRVLVVDDFAEMRTVIRRALGACGYEVEVASTLAEARRMGPAGYDAVLVDAHLGPERGADLVDALLREDPAAAGRCLMMTGGAVGPLPAGVACLTKPFQLGDLTDAVRALLQPVPASAPDLHADISPDSGEHSANHPGAHSTEPVSPGGNQQAADEPKAWQLLSLTRRLRAHERRELVDFLHDGPIQELTALTLGLQMMSRSAPSGEAARSDAMLRRLNAATSSLRWLMDGAWSFLEHETQLAAALQQRTAWMLAEPVTVVAAQQPTRPAATGVPVIVDVVELMLLAMLPPGQNARAHVAVRTPERQIQIELTLAPAAGGDTLAGDQAAARAALDELACALGASLRCTFCEQHWRARIDLLAQAVAQDAMT
jgi:DNA-binding response OmpR family regulator